MLCPGLAVFTGSCQSGQSQQIAISTVKSAMYLQHYWLLETLINIHNKSLPNCLFVQDRPYYAEGNSVLQAVQLEL